MIVEDTLITAILIFGGILEKFPDLKVCIAHGGGPACFSMGRLDRGWQVRSEARTNISRPPSTYQRQIYYDCITMSETALRFLIDSVGIDRVVLGSDWPFVPWDPSPTGWIQGLKSLSQEEKERILYQNSGESAKPLADRDGGWNSFPGHGPKPAGPSLSAPQAHSAAISPEAANSKSFLALPHTPYQTPPPHSPPEGWMQMPARPRLPQEAEPQDSTSSNRLNRRCSS